MPTNRENYFSKSYLSVNRWSTYSLLIQCVLELDPKKILEIGPGNRLVADILKKFGYNIKVLDINASLNPDYKIDIRNNSLIDLKGQFDLIIASQVLEHIKYPEFLDVMYNISLITSNSIITLPYFNKNSYFFSFNVNFPYFNKRIINRKGGFKLIYKKLPHFYNEVHEWEIGTIGFPLRKIKNSLKANGWIIKKSFFNEYYPYHYFFILNSRNY